jgi:hypothetical protein
MASRTSRSSFATVCTRLSGWRRRQPRADFNVLGTVRAGAAGMPKSELLKKEQKGEMKMWKLRVPKGSSKELRRLRGLLAINYCDSKSFMLLSTIPSDNFEWDPRHTRIPLTNVTVPRRRNGVVLRQPAPNLVAVYNSEMNGADVFDASWNRCEIGFSRMRKWTVVFFFAVLDFIVENSRIAYNWFSETKLSPAEYRMMLADQLLRPSTRKHIERLRSSFSTLVMDVRQLRDSPFQPVQVSEAWSRINGRVADAPRVCKYGVLTTNSALTCSAPNCKERKRSGTQSIAAYYVSIATRTCMFH